MQGLQIDALSAGYGARTVIERLSVEQLARGQICALLGPNGCGKSTLLRALAGLHPARGSLRLNGQQLVGLTPAHRSRQVVYLPQSLPDGVRLSVLESVLVAQRAAGEARADPQAVLALLTRLGIDHLALHHLDALSGGQKQLVGLAQSLIRRPALLLLDEPLSALDLNYQFHVMTLLREETQRRNIVTLVVLHDLNIALRHADHALLLARGRYIADGPPQSVITPAHLAQVYGVQARVESCSSGHPQLIIDGLSTPPLR
ncbi:ABC transporter ATP-binding protein [Edwardsiella tarda]|uniref:ABC transporter ATP-binding protein n=1 Tax=Edwardsiella tarda ATCC 15947 = NBRC 105688 TaxID=667121 RepID=A0AC61TMA3_EDWTA|nr:ABC transporter ATP-binding protein [Edwardsiella tarda]UAL55435.1 ABC transporter ATP-binding protein [Edwardsiella tarda]UCQ01513.1 ABC transporter ATP-binding protein [Edwardsiella tarda ATCC 15947 = NBRC 105688]UCQ12699.1 ABC transporter ATP-binding protein [Edwardsiella tarda]UCQ29063.1 ABC transporter ATP-binding protein [Edwardsiella tarda]WGE27805.1 ABC transporter ATP-binding protein [Edwardsiella tarda]